MDHLRMYTSNPINGAKTEFTLWRVTNAERTYAECGGRCYFDIDTGNASVRTAPTAGECRALAAHLLAMADAIEAEVAVKISEILWKAANEHLSDRQTSPGEVFICHAVKRADCSRYEAANDFLMRLGMIGDGGGFERWRGPEIPGKRQIDLDVQQQIRYAWLMFASMYAAELEAKGEL